MANGALRQRETIELKNNISDVWQNSNAKEKYLEAFIIVLLFGFGVYHAVLFFGHQLVPNSDFPGFIRVGRELLSLHFPSSYKRAPVVGLFQAGLSYLVGGPHPGLTAGWLLNAILHPFTIVLFWLVGKRIIGQSAVWFAIVAAINPMVLYMLTEPIAETTLLFFSLLTFYFIFKRSRWCYLFASITTMVRYEGAALILAALVVDMISCENNRQRVRTLLFAGAATLPLAIWMLATIMNWKSQVSSHYLTHGVGAPGSDKLFRFVQAMLATGAYRLLIPEPLSSIGIAKGLKLLVVGSFSFGVLYGLIKRQWNILTLLLFFGCYTLIHAKYSRVLTRYCMPVHWIVVLICLYGLISGWHLIYREGRVPASIVRVLQGILLMLAASSLIHLVPYLPTIDPVSPRSVSVPYVATAIIGAILVVKLFLYGHRHVWPGLATSSLMCVIVVSNQFVLVQEIGDGQRDIEFKLLADWYLEEADQREKLLTTLPQSVAIFASECKDSFVATQSIKARSPADFVAKCYENNITYVSWDSRVGLRSPDHLYYRSWRMKNIAMLAKPETTGPYEFVTQIRVNERQFINIFRLTRTTSPSLA